MADDIPPHTPEGERIYIPLSEKTRRGLDRLEGAAQVHDAFSRIPERDRTAGFRLALALCDTVVAELRIQHAQNALRDAARANVNMADKNLLTAMKEGKLVLFAAPIDLVDRAEAGHD